MVAFCRWHVPACAALYVRLLLQFITSLRSPPLIMYAARRLIGVAVRPSAIVVVRSARVIPSVLGAPLVVFLASLGTAAVTLVVAAHEGVGLAFFSVLCRRTFNFSETSVAYG